MKIYTLQSTLHFGKYQGQTIEQVMQHNPKYLIWCLENVRAFVLDENALHTLCIRSPREAVRFICQNMIKKSSNQHLYPDIVIRTNLD